jgi:hypothetical protein
MSAPSPVTAEAAEPALSPSAKPLLVALAFLLITPFALWNLSTWPARLRYPGELAMIEGMRLAEMKHLREGVPVYAPASPERFDAMIYGPLYYLLGARLIDPEQPAYFPLRLLGTLATLALAASCSLLAFWLSRRLLAAALAPLLVLAYGFVSLQGISARSDMVALVVSFTGFLLAFRFRDEAGLHASIPFFLAALFYKPQFIAAPAAVLVWLLVERRFRRAAQFAGLMTVGAVALLALFQYIVFAGQDFWLHLVEYNLLPFTLNRLGYAVLLTAVLFIVPALLALEFLRRSRDRLLLTYLLFVIPFTIFSLAKEGSASNYYLELVAVLAPPIAALAAQSVSNSLRAAEVLVLLVVALLAGTRLASFPPQPDDFARDRKAQEFLRRNFVPGTLALGVHSGDLVRAGLRTPISDFYQYTWLSCQGIIPEDQVLGQFRGRRFEVLLLGMALHDERDAHRSNDICMTEPLHQAILENYTLSATLEMPCPAQGDFSTRFYVWTPKSHTGVPPDSSTDGKADGELRMRGRLSPRFPRPRHQGDEP